MKYKEQTPAAPSFGLLAITAQYNAGAISFREWLKQAEDWARRVVEAEADKEKEKHRE